MNIESYMHRSMTMKNKDNRYISNRIFYMILVLFAFIGCILSALTIISINENKYFFITIIGYIILFGMSYFGYRWVYLPYKETSKILQLFAKGYTLQGIYELRFSFSPEMEDAIEKLKTFFNINELISATKRQSQYLALQNQINPHFLYNSLEGIRGEAITAGLDNVAEMAEALGTFFRYTISNMENLVTLEDELSNIENYYIIQQYRFGERLDLSIEYDCEDKEEAQKCRLPKLTLQPIVENSIFHGIERKMGRGHVRIKIETTPKRLIITVSDDGLGMKKERLRELNEKLNTQSFDYVKSDGEKKAGIGIVNVNNRIKLLYGEKYGINIYSTLNVGTDVEITLPLIAKKGNKNKMKEEVLRMERVTQIVDGVTLLDNFNLHIFKGEIMGLVCINAHGKETLIQLLCQNASIHYGHIYFQEDLVNNYEHSSQSINPVAVIEKQSRLVVDLTVADNVFVLQRGFEKQLIDSKMLNDEFRQLTDKLDINIAGNELVSNLSFFEKCIVEILKAVISGVKLIVIRDISNFISATDLKKIYNLIRYYSKQGISFLYICNHHEEAFKICDQISLMKNGKVLKVLDKSEFRDEMITPYTLDFSHIDSPLPPSISKNGILRFQNVFTDNIRDMSFTVKKGECIVFLDMNNTVLTDMIKLMNDEIKPLSGEIFLDGANYIEKISELKKGVCFIQENPIQSMLFQEKSYIDNLCFLAGKKLRNIWLNKNIKRSIIQEYEPLIGEDIYANDIRDLTPLSLYNLVYYRVHLYNPKVVFCMQPFSDADMYHRHHLIQLINQLRKRNITVIILAVSISDSLVVADRLLVIEKGKLRKEYCSDKFHLFRASQ